MKLVFEATGLTVEYDSVKGQDAIALNRFPNTDPDEGFLIVGTLEDLRGVVDSMSSLLDDLEDS